jgi:hypothetical protein
MSFLLPQQRAGSVRAARAVDIHGDRYVDVSVEFDGPPAEVKTGRVPAMECAENLAPGERVNARFVMGVMVKVER